MNADACRYVSYAIAGVASLAAMGYLRPVSEDYKRCILIIMAFFGLLLIFQHRAYDVRVSHICSQLLFRGDVLVLLLGRYLLKKSWKELFLALGIYGLVAGLAAFLPILENGGEEGISRQVFFSLDKYATFLFNGFIVWLFARFMGHRYWHSVLLAAAVSQCEWLASYCLTQVHRLISNLWGPFDGNAAVAVIYVVQTFQLLIPMAIYIMMLRFVFLLSWKRCVMCSLVILLPSLMLSILMYVLSI